MEIQIFDNKGKMVADRHYFPRQTDSDTSEFIRTQKPGVYIINVLVDDIVKKRKLRLR